MRLELEGKSFEVHAPERNAAHAGVENGMQLRVPVECLAWFGALVLVGQLFVVVGDLEDELGVGSVVEEAEKAVESTRTAAAYFPRPGMGSPP